MSKKALNHDATVFPWSRALHVSRQISTSTSSPPSPDPPGPTLVITGTSRSGILGADNKSGCMCACAHRCVCI